MNTEQIGRVIRAGYFGHGINNSQNHRPLLGFFGYSIIPAKSIDLQAHGFQAGGKQSLMPVGNMGTG